MKETTLYETTDRLLVAVDCIIFGFDGLALNALFTKRTIEPQKGKWSLMGGFVNKNESVTDAATRVLTQRTGLSDIYLEQIGCFGEVKRDTGGRVVSIAYFALIKRDEHDNALLQEHNSVWFPLPKIPKLIFDHENMLGLAKEKLKEKAATHPVGFSLLPKKFTLQQLQALYEAIYEKKLDKRNFIRKILELNVLKKLKEKETTSSRKGAFYFTFDKKKYEKLEKGTVAFF